MTTLPPQLAPWASQLAELPPGLALALVPWLGPLALAVGPLAEHRPAGSGEPDGYRGLARRGSYERLAIGEWGIAELFPDEFLRRATSGEHLFLELARREPQGERHSVAVVSAGPAQLGAPRLAQLAALVVLARRAAAGGARFAWGVLEDRARATTEELGPQAIARMLEKRTALEAPDGAFAAWRGELAPGADLWFVGGARQAAAARTAGYACMTVGDVLDPAIRALDVEVERRTARARVRLALPAAGETARLIRDPFGEPRGRRSTTVAAGSGDVTSVQFSPDGRRLIVRTSDSTLESWPIPGSPRDPLGAPQRWRSTSSWVIAALGVGRRAVIAMLVNPAEPGVVELGNGAGHRLRVTLAPALTVALERWLAGPRPVGVLGLIRHRRRGTDLVFQLGDTLGHIVGGFEGWPALGTRLAAQPLPVPSEGRAPVVACAMHTGFVVWAAVDESLAILVSSEADARVALEWRAPADGRVWLGPIASAGSHSWGIAALPSGPGTWHVVGDSLAPIELRTAQPVLGVARLGDAPALLVREDARRLAWTASKTARLPAERAEIRDAIVCPQLPLVAWITGAGDVAVYSTVHEAVVMRRTRGES